MNIEWTLFRKCFHIADKKHGQVYYYKIKKTDLNHDPRKKTYKVQIPELRAEIREQQQKMQQELVQERSK